MTAFVLSLLGTLVLVAAALVTGKRGQRRAHVKVVALVFVSLFVTILLAERLGRSYDLQAAGAITPVHLTLAKITTLAFLGPVLTGYRTWRDPAWRVWHRRAVLVALSLTALALVTGTWMIVAAPLR